MKLTANNKWSRVRMALCVMLIACAFTACRSPKETSTSAAGIAKANEELFASVVERSFRYETFSARMSLTLAMNDNEMSSKAVLRMVRGKLLQLSVQPISGFEVFRLELTPDSVKVVDRMNKRYVAGDYGMLRDEMNIDFNFQNLQALFANQMFMSGKDDVARNDFRNFRVHKNSSRADFAIKDGNDLMYTFTVDGDEKLLSTHIASQDKNYSLTWDYDNFKNANAQRFPSEMTVGLFSDERQLGTLTLTFSAPETDSPIKTDFKIPSGYKEMTFKQILQTIKTK